MHAPDGSESQELLRTTILKDGIVSFPTPSFETLFSEEPIEDYPFTKSYDELKDTAFMAVHTSGTSGHPKPIYWTHAAAATLTTGLFPDGDETPDAMACLVENQTVLMPFPLFHVSYSTAMRK